MIEDRKQIFEGYTGVKTSAIERTMCLYDRYFEANHIVAELVKQNVDFSTLNVVDYGCASGDYGMTLARRGASASFVDIVPACVEFAKHRMDRENLVHAEDEPNFVIFGEVLEHIESPLTVIKEYHDKGVKYIFTSSYPFRSDDVDERYWQSSGHRRTACLEQPEVRAFLNEHYESVRFEGAGAATLWTRKETQPKPEEIK